MPPAAFVFSRSQSLKYPAISGRTSRSARISACPYAWPWNVLGWPGVNVPAGSTDGGLRVGAQLLGPAGSERFLISLTSQLNDGLRWIEKQPPTFAES